jgi:hypothetical protein
MIASPFLWFSRPSGRENPTMKGKASVRQQKRQPPGKPPNTCLCFLILNLPLPLLAFDFIAFLLPRSGLVQRASH